jgi:hypothetical protein
MVALSLFKKDGFYTCRKNKVPYKKFEPGMAISALCKKLCPLKPWNGMYTQYEVVTYWR